MFLHAESIEAVARNAASSMALPNSTSQIRRINPGIAPLRLRYARLTVGRPRPAHARRVRLENTTTCAAMATRCLCLLPFRHSIVAATRKPIYPFEHCDHWQAARSLDRQGLSKSQTSSHPIACGGLIKEEIEKQIWRRQRSRRPGRR